MKKLRKNKFVVLAICVIIVSLVYFGAQKAIDNYIFNTNSDIVTEEESIAEGSLEGEYEDRKVKGEPDDSSGEISEEEIDLVLEEEVGMNNSSEVAGDAEGEVSEVNSSAVDSSVAEPTLEERKIYVYITGEVNSPGVVILNEGSRIIDAINAAGGTTIKANVSKVNLVYVLDDGMKVNIPNNNDLKNNLDFEYITMNSGDGGKDDYWEQSSEEESSFEGDTSSTDSGRHKNYSIVNINTATQTELETLPGIGPSLALKIINYRKENGKFSSIEEIKNVSGIGESKFNDFKSYISI